MGKLTIKNKRVRVYDICSYLHVIILFVLYYLFVRICKTSINEISKTLKSSLYKGPKKGRKILSYMWRGRDRHVVSVCGIKKLEKDFGVSSSEDGSKEVLNVGKPEVEVKIRHFLVYIEGTVGVRHRHEESIRDE